MRKIREILRLKHECGLSNRRIAASCSIARRSVAKYCRMAESSGIKWAEAHAMSDEDLAHKLTMDEKQPGELAGSQHIPDWNYLYQESKKPHVTLALLWQEYKEQHPEGYEHSWFHELYRRWRRKLQVSMRQDYRGGEKLFVDYADGLSIMDRLTGERRSTQLFVGVWGASNYTYAEATLTQAKRDWIMSHVRMFDYCGCAPRVVIGDNLKSAVRQACRYEPDINPEYLELAHHYGLSVMPARPYRPKDKAKVEAGVLVAQRWILASLRNRIFSSIGELNGAIRELLEKLNSRRMKKLEASRRELFERFDRPAALALPEKRYEYTRWQKARVNIDYHIEIDGHYYSVPYQLSRENVDVRITDAVIEIIHKGRRQASHPKSCIKHRHTTKPEHMPEAHRKYLQWSPSRILSWAGTIGPATREVAEHILASRAFPEQGYRSCLGILRLSKHYDKGRLENACKRAVRFRTFSFKSVRSILATGLDKHAGTMNEPTGVASPLHDNIRGRNYYDEQDTSLN